MKCPLCGEEVGDVVELESDDIHGGRAYNWEFGQPEYWFQGTFKCPACNDKFEYGDSSL